MKRTTRIRLTIAATSILPLVAQAAPDLDTLTTTEAAADLCAGKYSSETLIRAMLERASARTDLNAFITLDETGAVSAAQAIDAARTIGNCRPLEGVPVVIKDNIEAAGMPTTAGTPALKDYIPQADSPVVARLRDAGAVILGKTNMHELAFGISGYNTAFKSGDEPGVRNAYDRKKIAGGSSSGNGAAIGARIVTAGLGTDTGGSVRIPCALNGCASLRPTVGRYPQQGIVPISRSRDTAGPMAASMEDVALLDRVIAGGDEIMAADLSKVRVGVVGVKLANLDADTKAAFDDALGIMKANGVTVVEVEMPGLMDLNAAIGFPLALFEAYDDMVHYLDSSDSGKTIHEVAQHIASPDVKGTYDGLVIPRKLPGPDNTLVDAQPAYEAAMTTSRPALQALYNDTFSRHTLDALVFPTVPVVAIDANPDSSSVDNFVMYIQNTDPGSNAGLPGLQIPVSLGASSGLPVGLELDGPADSDRKLIAIGLALEGLFGRLPAPSR